MRHLEYKGYNKQLQEKVFHGSITKINVTLLESLRQLYSLEPCKRMRKYGMIQTFLYWYLRQSAESRTPGCVRSRRTSRWGSRSGRYRCRIPLERILLAQFLAVCRKSTLGCMYARR